MKKLSILFLVIGAGLIGGCGEKEEVEAAPSRGPEATSDEPSTQPNGVQMGLTEEGKHPEKQLGTKLKDKN